MNKQKGRETFKRSRPFCFLYKNLHDPVLELLARLETRDAASFDLDFRSGLRITADASLALRDIERAETGQRNFVSLAQALGDVVRNRVQRVLRQCLGDLAIFGERIYEFCLCHDWSPPFVTRF